MDMGIESALYTVHCSVRCYISSSSFFVLLHYLNDCWFYWSPLSHRFEIYVLCAMENILYVGNFNIINRFYCILESTRRGEQFSSEDLILDCWCQSVDCFLMKLFADGVYFSKLNEGVLRGCVCVLCGVSVSWLKGNSDAILLIVEGWMFVLRNRSNLIWSDL